MRSAISSTSFELVADEDDRHALAPQRAHDLEQVERLLRRQDGGRLVEDQDVGVPVERLHDLDALLLADADVLDERAGIDGEAERLRHVGDPLLRRRLVEQDAVLDRLGAEHDVLGDGHHRDEHEVLVHHADAGLDRVAGRAERDGLAVQADLARVRAGRARRGCSSASTCRRRSRRAARAPRRGARRTTTSSFATTPGNSLRMPRISRTSSSLTEADAIARRREGEIEAPSRSDGFALLADVAGGLSVPAMIFDLYWFIGLIHDCGTFGLILPTPTPLFFRLRRMSLPPGNGRTRQGESPCSTPTSVFLSALVRIFFATWYSSASTPMPHLPSFDASLSAPSPQRPATWKITWAPWPYLVLRHVAHASRR